MDWKISLKQFQKKQIQLTEKKIAEARRPSQAISMQEIMEVHQALKSG